MTKNISSWSNGIAEWVDHNTAFISVAFSWRVHDAYSRAVWRKAEGYKVRVGGPGLFMSKQKYIFEGLAQLGGQVDAVIHHNPNATFASRGCPVGCSFCIVPLMEGRKFTLLPEFTPRPILCDNNVSALPDDYQEFIIEKYIKSGVTLLDINSGFEPHSFSDLTYKRWKPINKGAWRFAFDEMKEENVVKRMIKILADEPSGKKRVYVLIGNEPFEQCFERVTKIIEWGCEPHVQPMIPLNALTKSPLVQFDWTEQRLKDLARWANRWIWRSAKFDEYKRAEKLETVSESQLKLFSTSSQPTNLI